MTALEPRKNLCGTRRKQGIPCRLLLVLGALVASCSGERQPGIYQDGQPVRPFTSTENNNFQVRWASQPHPIPINEPFEIILDVLGPEADLTLEVEGWMPGHGHGMVRTPRVTPLGQGRYRVQGMLFHMEGAWELRVALAWREDQGDSFVIQRDNVVFEVQI
ncbi:hypothetical protein CMO84_05930 [Candidatus Woesearchaeota archaeon]|nr:hypothetical protein [Candidatus Woesearchaeota archaeon]MDP6739967.1 FixH family protein [Planctomycetota bacterium]MDP6937579.1 FixH family protein [Planctomycetota bacterium]